MKIKLDMNSYRFGQMTKKGGIWEGQQIPTLWESKVAMGQEKGTIQNMMIDYISNVKKAKQKVFHTIAGKLQAYNFYILLFR